MTAQRSWFVGVGLSRPFSDGKQIAGVSIWKSMLHAGISKASNIDVHSFSYVLGTGDLDGVFTRIAECVKRDPQYCQKIGFTHGCRDVSRKVWVLLRGRKIWPSCSSSNRRALLAFKLLRTSSFWGGRVTYVVVWGIFSFFLLIYDVALFTWNIHLPSAPPGLCAAVLCWWCSGKDQY